MSLAPEQGKPFLAPHMVSMELKLSHLAPTADYVSLLRSRIVNDSLPFTQRRLFSPHERGRHRWRLILSPSPNVNPIPSKPFEFGKLSHGNPSTSRSRMHSSRDAYRQPPNHALLLFIPGRNGVDYSLPCLLVPALEIGDNGTPSFESESRYMHSFLVWPPGGTRKDVRNPVSHWIALAAKTSTISS